MRDSALQNMWQLLLDSDVFFKITQPTTNLILDLVDTSSLKFMYSIPINLKSFLRKSAGLCDLIIYTEVTIGVTIILMIAKTILEKNTYGKVHYSLHMLPPSEGLFPTH